MHPPVHAHECSSQPWAIMHQPWLAGESAGSAEQVCGNGFQDVRLSRLVAAGDAAGPDRPASRTACAA
eukprot:scaffold254717_cov22-Tisochrysis_lutea.AAC.1